MKLRSRLGAVVIAGLFTLASLGGARAGVFNPSTITLANGLQVVVIENHRAPVVTHMVWYRVGAADEVPGKTGIAHFSEHLMFKGTKTVPPGAFSEMVARLGGNENAFTTEDYTAYFQSVAVEHLEEMMKLEADRMVNLVLTDDVVLPERDVILEERRQRVDNDPGSQLMEMARAALFLNHPYRMPTIGWEKEMRGLTTADAIAWHQEWYAPNNAIVVISGDVTMDQVRPLAEKYYGALPATTVPVRARPDEPAQFAPRRLTKEDPRVQLASWTRLYQAPSYHRGAKEHAYALEVLAELLGGGTSSRLYRSLVVEQKLASSAASNYDGDNLDLSTFSLYASAQSGGGVGAIEQAMDAEIARLLKDGATEDEVTRAKVSLQAEAVKARDSLSGPARLVGAALATGSTIDDIEAWPDRIGAVTVADVNAAAKAVFDINYSVTAILLPKAGG
ncbi:MAG TPA: pitrilysin family protein [Candidatus Angelobacter sp.]|nr:pitrilysin family protein [Candidatus Angelobacter sp.]